MYILVLKVGEFLVILQIGEFSTIWANLRENEWNLSFKKLFKEIRVIIYNIVGEYSKKNDL